MSRIIINNLYKGRLPKGIAVEAKKLVRRILKEEGRGIRDEVCITFVDDKEIKALNRKFRKKDRSTDVLAFEMNEERMLGDVVISVDSARRNAARFKVTLALELKRLVVHGILHLLGYDHVWKKDKVVMRAREEKHL